jgi:hypothetical protein
MKKRLRLLIYEHDTKEALEKQRALDTVFHRWGKQGDMNRVWSIELNPLRITIMQVLRLFRKEASVK